jgi:hypothetical protein
MPAAGSSSSAVPYGADQTIYVVVDNCGQVGSETQFERADLETVVNEFMAGRFFDPIRVVAFNTLEHWSKDLSFDVATEVQARCDIECMPIPDHVRDFLDTHRLARVAQLNRFWD